jgi:hypothetical protein
VVVLDDAVRVWMDELVFRHFRYLQFWAGTSAHAFAPWLRGASDTGAGLLAFRRRPPGRLTSA